MAFKFTETGISGVLIVEPDIYRDPRGFFMETYKMSDFKRAGITEEFVQDNHSLSSKGILRGLHYQINPGEQGKLIRVASGSIFDVALDLRKNSETFGKFAAFRISSWDRKMIWIPPGLAHGFLSLEDNTEVLYKTTTEYNPELERGILWNDPDLDIPWPLENPIVSDKDSKFPFFRNADFGNGGKKLEVDD